MRAVVGMRDERGRRIEAASAIPAFDRCRHRIDSIGVHEREHAAAEPAAGHPRAVRPRVERRDTAVSTCGTVISKSSRIDSCDAVRTDRSGEDRARPQHVDDVEHPSVLGDDVADPPAQQVVIEAGQRGIEVVERDVAQRGDAQQLAALDAGPVPLRVLAVDERVRCRGCR